MMRFKIDENIHPDLASFLRQHGHDVATVWDEGLRGTTDANLAHTCQKEKRALITLDQDFADIRSYPPEQYYGLIVLRVAKQHRTHLLDVLTRILPLLHDEALTEHLWVVDESSVRIRGTDVLDS